MGWPRVRCIREDREDRYARHPDGHGKARAERGANNLRDRYTDTGSCAAPTRCHGYTASYLYTYTAANLHSFSYRYTEAIFYTCAHCYTLANICVGASTNSKSDSRDSHPSSFTDHYTDPGSVANS